MAVNGINHGLSGDVLINCDGKLYWVNGLRYNDCVEASMKVLTEEVRKAVEERISYEKEANLK